MYKIAREVALFTAISFALHFVWESLHLPLYTGYASLSGGVPIALWATIGDALYAIAAVALFSLFKRQFDWLERASAYDFFALAVIGFLIAVGIEYKALMFGRWAYTGEMPIVPLLRVGLSPVLQMTVLLPTAAYLARIASRRFG